MAEIDKQKEKIILLRSILILLLGALLTLIAFIFTNFDKLFIIKLIISNVAAIVLSIIILSLLYLILKEIDKLKDMNDLCNYYFTNRNNYSFFNVINNQKKSSTIGKKCI